MPAIQESTDSHSGQDLPDPEKQLQQMFKTEKLVRGLVTRIRHAERIALSSLAQGHIEQEPAFTDRLLGAMAHALDGVRVGGVMWAAGIGRVLRVRVPLLGPDG